MRHGGLGKGIRLEVPCIYIEPKIMYKDGEVDKEILQTIHDIWKNYDVNIRYLFVHPNGTDLDPHKLDKLIDKPKPLRIIEHTVESSLLSHLQPETIVAFFGRKEVLPSNHKVFSRDELLNNYTLILSNLCNLNKETNKTQQRYRRRRG